MIKILIVGGTGFLGQACLTRLLPYSSVSVIGRESTSTLAKLENFKYHQVDILDPKKAKEFLEKNDYSHLIYLAWPSTPPHNSMGQISFASASVSFLKIFSEYNPCSRVVCIGSIYEVGVSDNLYGLCKKFVYDCMQILLLTYLKKVSFCWVRLSNVYGIGDHSHKLLSKIISTSLQGETLILDNPDGFVDFVHVKDAATGIILALFSNYEGIMNIGAGQGYFLKDIKKFIEDYVKDRIKSHVRGWPFSKFGPVLDIKESTQILGYIPTISIEEGLIQLLDSTVIKTKNHG